jgi:hypothetical protein
MARYRVLDSEGRQKYKKYKNLKTIYWIKKFPKQDNVKAGTGQHAGQSQSQDRDVGRIIQ